MSSIHLRYLLPALIFSFGIVIAVISYLGTIGPAIDRIEHQREKELRDKLIQMQGVLETFTDDQDVANKQRFISSYGSDERLEVLFLADAEGTIMAATRFRDIGEKWQNLTFEIDATHQQSVAENRTTSVHLSSDRSRIIGMTSVCYDLSGSSELRTNMCDFLYQVEDISADKSSFLVSLRRQTGWAMVGLVLASLGVLFVLNRMLTRPVEKLVSVTQDIIEGHTTSRTGIKSKDELGQIAHAIDAMLDQLTSAQLRLERSEARLLHHIENTPLAAISWDENFRCLEWNKAAEKIFGYSAEESIGKHASELIVPENIKNQVNDVYQQLINQEGGSQNTNENVTKSGNKIICEWYNTPILDENGQVMGITSLALDITDRMNVEAHLIQSSKLASLGEMATGIAHELNQPLNIIRMATETLNEMMNDEEIAPVDIQQKLERIENQIERAAAIVNHMRMFGRGATDNKELISVVEVVNNATHFVQEQYRVNDIDLIVEAPDSCPFVHGNLIQLEQVILNLLSNAQDSIEKKRRQDSSAYSKGRISIRVEVDWESNFIKISIHDTGTGIPQELISRIFEPFFTTKEIGKGTGIGLSISYGIIDKMDGTLSARNTNEGAEFCIFLPTVERQVPLVEAI